MNLFVRFLVSKLHTGFRQLRMHIERRRKLHFEFEDDPRIMLISRKANVGTNLCMDFQEEHFSVKRTVTGF